MDDDIRKIREKIELLNDWHHTVDRRLDILDERLRWVLRIAAVSLMLSAGEKLAPSIFKLFGG
jgi:hypothetical protein